MHRLFTPFMTYQLHERENYNRVVWLICAQCPYNDRDVVLTSPQPPLRHLPGQYVDLHIPGVSTVGGFTITSPPQTAVSSSTSPYIELAIQKSPGNPPAAYLWQRIPSIQDAPISFKIGGNFAYPPLTRNRQECESIDRAVFIAGGVGINPIMSMLSAIDGIGEGRIGGVPKTVRVLYSSRRGKNDGGSAEAVLFEDRLADLSKRWSSSKSVDWEYTFFETNGGTETSTAHPKTERRRIAHSDLIEALGPEDSRANTVVYVCGIPQMTDDFVAFLSTQPGMNEKRVLCEKWW